MPAAIRRMRRKIDQVVYETRACSWPIPSISSLTRAKEAPLDQPPSVDGSEDPEDDKS